MILNGKCGKGQKKTKLDRSKNSEDPGYTRTFTMDELINAISSLNPGKAIGLDDIATEQIKYLGPEAKKWLLELYNHCLKTHELPKILQKAHVIALL